MMKFINRTLNPTRRESIIIVSLIVAIKLYQMIFLKPDDFNLFVDGLGVFIFSIFLITRIRNKKPINQSNDIALISKGQKVIEIVLFCIIILCLLQAIRLSLMAFNIWPYSH